MESDTQLLIRLGERIRKLRQAKGLSQEGFALECGIDRTYVSGIERGVRNPTIQVLSVLARGLGTTVSNVTKGIDAPAD
jgi:transcriptional regulator with XRE-family HTH domain